MTNCEMHPIKRNA